MARARDLNNQEIAQKLQSTNELFEAATVEWRRLQQDARFVEVFNASSLRLKTDRDRDLFQHALFNEFVHNLKNSQCN